MGDVATGTGKSLVIVAHIAAYRPARTLILCPKSVVGVWPSQFEQHLDDPHSVAVHAAVKGSVKQRLDAARDARDAADCGNVPFVLVLNHEAAWRAPMGDALTKMQWDLVVIDESHRSSSKPRSKFYTWAWKLRAKKRVCLSGTPLSHSPLNAWPQYKFLDPACMHRTFTSFKAQYAEMNPYGYKVNGRPVQISGYKNLDDLERRIAPYTDVVDKADVLDLPPVTHVDLPVDLPAAAMRTYRELEDEMIAMTDRGAITAANVLAKSIRLQQIAQGFCSLEEGGQVAIHDAKQATLVDLLTDLPDHEPVVVFCRFHHDLDKVADAAVSLGRPVDELSGRRNDIGHKWEPRAGAVAAVQIQAGGVGIDLTAAAYCVYFAQTWSIADYDQSLARLDRPGQTRNVTYYHLIARNTIDDTIRRALVRRRSIVDAIMDRLKCAMPAALLSGRNHEP